MSAAWGNGSTRRWRRLRRLILERDGYMCGLKIEGICLGRATEVHHVLGKGVSESPRHLMAACRPCNNRVGEPSKHKDPKPTKRTNWGQP